MSQPIAAAWVDRNVLERGNPQGIYVEAKQDDEVVTPATASAVLTDPVGTTHNVSMTVDASLLFYAGAYTPLIVGRWTYVITTTVPAFLVSGGFTVRDNGI